MAMVAGVTWVAPASPPRGRTAATNSWHMVFAIMCDLRRVFVVAIATMLGCATPRPEVSTPPAPPTRCALPAAPEIVKRDGAAVLERWELPAADVLFSAALPDDAGYARYRRAIHEAGGDVIHPIADPPEITTDALREVWRREDLNLALAYSGQGGTIRPIHCLEALLFARQHARHDELTSPTELGVLVLRRIIDGQPMLRIYMGSSDVMFPPHSVYGSDEATADHAAGWELLVHLHNHTIRKHAGKPALGVTAPSTNDVQFLRSLAEHTGLASAWVTNGVFTIEIPAAALARYQPPAS